MLHDATKYQQHLKYYLMKQLVFLHEKNELMNVFFKKHLFKFNL